MWGRSVCAQFFGPSARQTTSLLSPPALRSARRQSGDACADLFRASLRAVMSSLEHTIDLAWEKRATLTRTRIEKNLRPAIEDALALLESGKRRVAEPNHRGWRVNLWLKKAVLLYFRVTENHVIGVDPQLAFDKVPLRFAGF